MKHVKTQLRTSAARAWCAPRLLGVAALVAAPLVGVFAASPAGAGTAVTADFISGAASFKSGANTWMLSVNYTDSGTTTGLGSGVGVSIQRFGTGNTNYELHSWEADAKGATFNLNSSTGKLTVNSGSSLKPVASYDVSFVPTKKTVTACPITGKETVYTGTLKGSVDLVTGTKPVSITLKSSTASFTSGTNTLTVDPCEFSFPCFGDSWSAPESTKGLPYGTVAASGEGIYKGSALVYLTTVIRQTELSAARAFIREDGASTQVSAPKWNATAKTLAVAGSSSSSGIVTGSGILTGGKAIGPLKESCNISGKSHLEQVTSFAADAKLSKWMKFVAHTVLTGTLTEAITSTSLGGFVIYKLIS